MTNLQSLRQRKFLDRPAVFEKFALTQVFLSVAKFWMRVKSLRQRKFLIPSYKSLWEYMLVKEEI